VKKEQTSSIGKIDVHSHCFAPALWKLLEEVLGPPEGSAVFSRVKETKNRMQRLNPEERVEFMDQFGIEKSVSCFPAIPGYMGASEEVKQSEKRKKIAQYMNDYFAEVHQKYPKRLLFFADVPLAVDVEFSCRELHRAIEDLGLEGVAIQTNIAGKRLSEPDFEEFFAEAEKIGAIVFVHPQSAYGREHMRKYMTAAMLGYPADTTLTAAYMILDGFMERHPKLKIILNHLGGFIPYLHRRLNVFTEDTTVDPVLSGRANLSKQPSEYLGQFYYDTALGNSEALELCLKVAGVDHILFGTDHPYVEKGEVKTIDFINRTRLTGEERDKIYSLNARRLLRA
jgi:predicted TIM-barrel fold metal-dependent hydrolase